MRHEEPLPLGAHAYLDAFDRYLAAVRDELPASARAARHEMREQLDVMVDSAGTTLDQSAGKRQTRFRRYRAA